MMPDGWKKRKISDIFEKVVFPVSVIKDKEYKEIGIRSHGKGIFYKEKTTGKSLGNKRVFHIEPNCFILNIVFAWEQAIAKTTQAELGMIASHRFPMFRPKNNLCDVDFILYFFKTKLGKHLLELASPGGAGRNKTLGQTEFARLEIVLPSLSEQIKIAQILSAWDKAITTTEKLLSNNEQHKKALMQQLLTGKKRFPGFTGRWGFSSFKDLFVTANDKTKQVKSSDYSVDGSIPIVDQGQQLIAGYTSKVAPYTNVPVIIFGDHTRALKWIDFSFCPGADGTQILKTQNLVRIKYGYYMLCNTHISNLGYSRHMRELKENEFKFPTDLKEQEKIDNFLSVTDKVIQLLQQKLDCLRQEKKALMQQLLTGKRRVKI